MKVTKVLVAVFEGKCLFNVKNGKIRQVYNVFSQQCFLISKSQVTSSASIIYNVNVLHDILLFFFTCPLQMSHHCTVNI